MNIGLVGCGFVADYYISTLAAYPHLKVIGATDRDPDRAARFTTFHKLPKFDSLQGLLADERVEMVLNLTNPGSHYEVTKACLEADKHVYSEKPLAMNMDHARELVETAERKSLQLASAPCSLWARRPRRFGRLSANAGSGRLGWSTPRWTTEWSTAWPTASGPAPRASPGRRRTSSRSVAPSSTPATT
jgi:hypothetical protein